MLRRRSVWLMLASTSQVACLTKKNRRPSRRRLAKRTLRNDQTLIARLIDKA